MIIIVYHGTREMSSLPRKNIDELMRRDYDLKQIEVFNDADSFGENNSTPLYASENTPATSIADLFDFVKQNDKNFSPARF